MLVDFTAWASPTLDLTLGGRTYKVRPPSVGGARILLAMTVRSELRLGIVTGQMPAELQQILDEIADTPAGVLTLGQDVYDQMVTDDLPAMDIDRAAYYAMHYWVRSKAQADMVAAALWSEGDTTQVGDPAGPKAPARSRNGRRTGSGSRTKTASTPTTASPPS